MKKQQARRKVEIAIDKLIDLQNAGYGNDLIARILEKLNILLSDLIV